MDIDAVRKKRQEEIEAKKKRLEELKKAKEAAASAPKADVAPKPTFSLPTPTSPLPSARPSAQVLDERDAVHESKSERETNDLVSSILSSSSRSGAKSDGFDVQYNRADKIKSFSLSRLSTTILPVERVSYNKECQTEEDDQTFLRDNEAEEEESRVYGEAKRVESSSHILMTPGRKAAPVGDGTLSAAASSSFSMHATQSHAQQPPQHHARKLSDEETQHILTDDKFLQFFEHATLHVERALEFNTSFDILRDYAADTSKQTSGEKAVTHTSTYYDCDFLKQRPIMDLKCSQLRPELFLAAYGSKPSLAPKSTTTAIANAGHGATNEDDAPGLVCIWARDLHTRPEIKLVASSPVLTAEFHHSEPQLVFGGCYNGQILLWDMSKSRSLPVQRSSWIAGKGHKHPVYAMAQTLSHELVTVSIDGMMCLWDVSRLTEPITTAMLEIPVPKPLGSGDMPTASSSTSLFSPPPADFRVNQPPLNVSCMAYAQSDNASYIVVGSGAGELFKTQLPYKHTDASNLKLDAHFGLITAVHMHPMANSTKYKHLLLTSSLDWTVKLWSMHQLQQPLYEFFSPTCDYVCDVQWSPTHPAVFFTVSSTGQVALWNLAKSLTEPVDMLDVSRHTAAGHDDDAAAAGGAATTAAAAAVAARSSVGLAVLPSALHKALFSRDGQFIVVGDSTGVLHRLKVHPSHVSISASDESRLNMVLLTATNTLSALQSPAGKGAAGHSKAHSSSAFAQKESVMKGASLLDDFDDDADA